MLNFLSNFLISVLCYYASQLINSVVPFGRMQVEVSKYTEGKSEKELRPNGLPTSLIRYDGR